MKLIKLFVAFLILLALAGLFWLSVYMGLFGALPGKKQLTSISNEEASLVFSSDNVLIGKYFALNRTNIKWKEIPEHLVDALVATEDKRFFSHKGTDAWSYFRVFFKSILLQDNAGGGSTLTQQLVKNLYGRKNHGILTLPVNKVKEIIIASRLEEIYNKEELLLLYLNSVPFGENVYGVESAARRFFSKPASKLKVEESAVLIGMLKANTTYNPVLNPENSRNRRNVVLSLMAKEKHITSAEADSLKKLPLKLNYEKVSAQPAGYFVHQVKMRTRLIIDSINNETGEEYDIEKDGLRIYTTLNMKMQEYALAAVKTHLTSMQKLLDKELANRQVKKQWLARQKKLSKNEEDDSRKRKIRVFDWQEAQAAHMSRFDSLWHYYKMLHASVLISDPASGAVLTWIGGNNFQLLPFDMVLSHRQIASAFKPVLFAAALENEIAPCQYLENSKNKYEGYDNWEPENFDKKSTPDSTVAFWYALTHSMNLPSVDLYFKVGRSNLVNTCETLRLPQFKYDAPSIALGTLDVSLYEIVRAYGAFANQGKMADYFMITKITDAGGKVLYSAKSQPAEEVLSPQTCEAMTAMLQQAITQGTGAGIRSRFGVQSELAGKTGTAQNYSDAWFIAYTPRLVIGTWVGASTPDVHFFSRNGSGSALALPVVGSILKNMENNAELRKKYLQAFALPEESYAFLQCEPYKQISEKGFFNKLFGRDEKQEKDTARTARKKQEKEEKVEKDEKDIRSIIRRLFQKKKE